MPTKPTKTRERDCHETHCDLCGEIKTEKEVYNFYEEEWDAICSNCYDWNLMDQCHPDYDVDNW